LRQRLARSLLLARNRLQRTEMPMTHEFLSQLLGAPRSEISLAVGNLRNAGLITCRRKQITIENPNGLEAVSCECYHLIAGELRALSYPARARMTA
jgi:hypothetical protein